MLSRQAVLSTEVTKVLASTTLNIADLRRLLDVILVGTYTSSDVSSFVNICHRFATAYLHVSASRGMFGARSIGISVDQLALDSIADLFSRDRSGSFQELRRYYSGIGPVAGLSDDQFVSSLRRLIFSAVKNHRYRTFQQSDPAVARISRNIKLTLKRHALLMLTEKHGLATVELRAKPKERECLPELPPEFLYAEFFAAGIPKANLRGMLDLMADILSSQPAYAASVPLVQLCEVVHRAYLLLEPEVSGSADEPSLADWELRGLIEQVISTLNVHTLGKYVRKGKLPESVACSYRATLTEILESTFCSADGEDTAYFSVLQKYLPGLDKKAYQDRHRMILEYLAKMAKADMRARLQAEFDFLPGGQSATRNDEE